MPPAPLSFDRSSTSGAASACPDEEALVAFARGDATAGERATVRGHVAACATCRHVLAAFGDASLAGEGGALAGPGAWGGDGVVSRRGVEGGAGGEGPSRVFAGSAASGASTEGDEGAPFHAPPPVPGQTLGGKYRVERVIGRGGMGVVVEATHLVLAQRVAVKVLARADAEGRARFLREARAVAALRGEHVAHVFDAGALGDGRPYLVMELLDGTDLRRVLAARGRLPAAEAAGYVLEAAGALAEAHALGLVHRDVKPANLFLARDEGGRVRLKVLDFGLAKVVGGAGGAAPDADLTSSSTVLGSPTYMAPEQITGARAVDARADVWSLAVTLFELVAGAPPFRADSFAALCATILRDEPARLGPLAPDAPAELAALLARCLAKDPGARPASAAEFARALAPFVSGAGAPAAGVDRPAGPSAPAGGAGAGGEPPGGVRAHRGRVPRAGLGERARPAFGAAIAFGALAAAIALARGAGWRNVDAPPSAGDAGLGASAGLPRGGASALAGGPEANGAAAATGSSHDPVAGVSRALPGEASGAVRTAAPGGAAAGGAGGAARGSAAQRVGGASAPKRSGRGADAASRASPPAAEPARPDEGRRGGAADGRGGAGPVPPGHEIDTRW
jgi:serine/threonine-protein kinase